MIAKRAAPYKWDFERLQNFDRQHEQEIRNLSVALSDDEILSYYGLEIGDLSEYDRLFFEITTRRGRLIAVQNAASHLFDAMSGKNALAASLAYLTRHGNNAWKNEGGTGDSVAGKTVRLIIEE